MLQMNTFAPKVSCNWTKVCTVLPPNLAWMLDIRSCGDHCLNWHRIGGLLHDFRSGHHWWSRLTCLALLHPAQLFLHLSQLLKTRYVREGRVQLMPFVHPLRLSSNPSKTTSVTSCFNPHITCIFNMFLRVLVSAVLLLLLKSSLLLDGLDFLYASARELELLGSKILEFQKWKNVEKTWRKGEKHFCFSNKWRFAPPSSPALWSRARCAPCVDPLSDPNAGWTVWFGVLEQAIRIYVSVRFHTKYIGKWSSANLTSQLAPESLVPAWQTYSAWFLPCSGGPKISAHEAMKPSTLGFGNIYPWPRVCWEAQLCQASKLSSKKSSTFSFLLKTKDPKESWAEQIYIYIHIYIYS